MLNKKFRKPKAGDRVLCYGRTEGIVQKVGPQRLMGPTLSDEELLVTLELKDGKELDENVRKEEAEVI